MVDTSRYIYTAIEKVFGSNPGRLVMAKTYYSQNLQNIGAVYAYLNDLCGCNFESSAGLHNIAVSSEVTHTISNAISSAGGVISPSSICGKVGTLGSFYSCSSPADTSPTLVATGSELCSLKSQGFQNCTNWARTSAITSLGASVVSDSTKSIYISSSPSGGCFRFVGGMYTVPAMISNPTGASDTVLIPSVKVSCSSGCSTSQVSFSYAGSTYILPSLPVICSTGGTCNTVPLAVPLGGGWPIVNIPAMNVEFANPSIGSLASLCEYYLDH